MLRRSTVIAVTLALGALALAADGRAWRSSGRAVEVPELRGADTGGAAPTLDTLLRRVTLDAVRDHQWAFQAIADRNGGTRASGTPGYDESAIYVAARLTRAGYRVRQQAFEFVAWLPQGPSAAEQLAPQAEVYAGEVDFNVVHHSEPGDITAPVMPVDLALDAPTLSTSGCNTGDFSGFVAGHVALLQRGGCSFRQKAERAAARGAVAVVIFNQGHSPAYQGLFGGTLTAEYSGGIPVFGTTFERGVAWSRTPGLRLHLVADLFRGSRTAVNVTADSPRGRADRVVMAGAHLDSVPEGPGIQDNGSGSAALLAVAEALAGFETRQRVRFAWWGAEEAGLVGSSHYVEALSATELAALDVYLNFDMIGSPNYARFVLDGDGSAFGEAGPTGSAAAETVFNEFHADRGLAIAPARLDYRSDYAPFAFAGVPVGGLFTGAEGTKTTSQAATFGGVAGAPFDPCYHAACDTYDNVDLGVLEHNADAIAYAVYMLATDADPARAAAKRAPQPLPQHLRYHAGHEAQE